MVITCISCIVLCFGTNIYFLQIDICDLEAGYREKHLMNRFFRNYQIRCLLSVPISCVFFPPFIVYLRFMNAYTYVYIIMHLDNNIVIIETGFGDRTENVANSYNVMCCSSASFKMLEIIPNRKGNHDVDSNNSINNKNGFSNNSLNSNNNNNNNNITNSNCFSNNDKNFKDKQTRS